MRQHAEAHLDPRPRQAAATEPPQVAVGLGIGEPQLHRLTPPAVNRLGLRRLHLALEGHDQILMFIPFDRPPGGTGGAPRPKRAGPAVLTRATIGRSFHRPPRRALPRIPADRLEPMALRTDRGLLRGPRRTTGRRSGAAGVFGPFAARRPRSSRR